MGIARAGALLMMVGCMAGCAPKPPPPPPQIHVVSASYGPACGSATGNHTDHLANDCNGKLTCQYLVDNRYGDPYNGCAKDFAAEWNCGGQSPPRSLHHAAAAGEGYEVTLSCQ